MFASGSLNNTPFECKTLQHYLINSTFKRVPSNSTSMEGDIPAMMDSIHQRDDEGLQQAGISSKLVPSVKSDIRSNLEIYNKDRYQTSLDSCSRDICGHTTCKDTCLYQTYRSSERLEVDRDSTSCQERELHQGHSPLTGIQEECQWNDLLMNSPADTQRDLNPQHTEEEDALLGIDYSLRQSVEAEIEAFRINLHNFISDHHQQYRQVLLHGIDPITTQNSVCDHTVIGRTNYEWSQTNSSAQCHIEESSGSSFRIQDDGTCQLYQPNSSQEDDINYALLQLLTSANAVSHTLRRQEYTT
ncbi:uncharacterized protein LOC110974368 isoform X2 [Acanthaster planci]|nr:uncharacterized protein LOC110974368 isoform X2 [Acanthaster planci]